MDAALAFDAIVVLSFGGPEGPDDVMPFLRNVTRGRGVPDERLAEVAAQYERFGGVSPINDQNRALIAALDAELGRRGRDLPIHFGNRNWTPYVADAFEALANRGYRRVLALATSAYSSYSGCRQYHEDIARGLAHLADLGRPTPEVVKVRPFWNHPGFVDATVDRVATALADAGGPGDDLRIVFTGHSIPVAMAETCDYVDQLTQVATLVSEHVPDAAAWDLVFQSRSGPPRVPWLEPDIVDHLAALAAEGIERVVVAPIGFLSDHMEVLFDLDTQAAAAAEELGLMMVRADTVGTHPTFVHGLVDLLDEYLVDAEPQAIGPAGPHPPCAADCCPPPRRA